MVALVLTTSPVTAQVAGLPVFQDGIPRGLELAADVGFPNDVTGGGTAYGVEGTYGFGVIGIGAQVAGYNPSQAGTSTSTSFAGLLNVRVFGGPLIPFAVSLQGGVGYRSYDATDAATGPEGHVQELRLPAGVGITVTIPSPVVAFKPWIAPRIDMLHVDVGGDGNTYTDFGVSAGLDVVLLNGLGLRLAYDWVNRTSGDPTTVSVGASYSFRR